MGMLIHIQVAARADGGWSHMVDKNKWTDHSFSGKGEEPSHQEIADIPAAFFDDKVGGGH